MFPILLIGLNCLYNTFLKTIINKKSFVMVNKMNKTKIIAIYFPQFHPTPENDKWWGKDFSDWNLVKTAEPLFEGHYQPRIPLDGYYDPREASVLQHQAKLAKKYGINGFMFYHYWFDGKMMLQKPMETFLEHPEIDIHFFVSWANGTWTRQWLGKNEILIEQKHTPTKELWKLHFDYLLPFFKDKRYILIDNKPVFSIYCPDIIKSQKEMFLYWNELAVQNGFSGIHFMAIKNFDFPNTSFLQNYDSMMKFQPREANTSFKNPNRQKSSSSKVFRLLPEKIRFILGDFKRKVTGYTKIDSHGIWDYILKNACINDYEEFSNLKIFESAYFSWDNTARYRNRATIYSELSKEEKKDYFSKLYKLCCQNNDSFIFINAWNEWSESAYIEPDTKNGYENLEIINSVINENY